MYDGNTSYGGSTSQKLIEDVVVPTAGTVVGSGTLLNKQDTYNISVQASGTSPYYSGSFSFSDSKADDTFDAVTITSIVFGPGHGIEPLADGAKTAAIANPISVGESWATIFGTATLNGGTSASYNFVAHAMTWNGPTPVGPVAGSAGSLFIVVGSTLSIEVTGPNGFQYSGGGLLDPGSTLSITESPSPVTPRPTPTMAASVYGKGNSAAVHQAVFARWALDGSDSAAAVKRHGLLSLG